MNVFVIATHHGAFITLQQLKQWNVKNVVVVIPQSQIDKYKKFGEDLFTNYEKLVKKFCGRKFKVYVSENWNAQDKMRSAHGVLSSLGKTGQWVVLEAGGILGGLSRPLPMTATYGVCYARRHPKMTKLYKMLGEPEETKTVYPGCFMLNMDDTSGRMTILPEDTFHRADILYAKSFGAGWALRYQHAMDDCIAMNFWMEAIKSKQEGSEWIAYPYDRYLGYAEKVSDLLPKSSYNTIVENGLNSEWLYELIALDL